VDLSNYLESSPWTLLVTQRWDSKSFHCLWTIPTFQLIRHGGLGFMDELINLFVGMKSRTLYFIHPPLRSTGIGEKLVVLL